MCKAAAGLLMALTGVIMTNPLLEHISHGKIKALSETDMHRIMVTMLAIIGVAAVCKGAKITLRLLKSSKGKGNER